jgi:lipopolysaccharide biosynthesis regulator YciM
MSQTPTISQPPEPLGPTPSRVPPPPAADAVAEIEGTVRRLRAELTASPDRARQARLLAEIADLEERAGDEPAAARDYLAAYNADATFREPLEGLVRLLEKRRSLKNLGRLLDALARAASTPEEKVRGLLMRASYQADVAGDLSDAKAAAREATETEGAPPIELASAWLNLEVLGGRAGDPATREEALAQRAALATDPGWRALLLIDGARLALTAGETERGFALLDQARGLGSAATWTALTTLENAARGRDGATDIGDGKRAGVHAGALEAMASLVQESLADAARGDAVGVPLWMRDPLRLVDLWLRAAEARRLAGQLDGAAQVLDLALESVAGLEDGSSAIAAAALAHARIRAAELSGDRPLAARLAEQRLPRETDGGVAAALALRVADQAAAEGNAARALDALARAISSDPGSLPARALQLDMLAEGGDAAAFAAQLESFAEHLATDEARGRSFLLAAYVWALRANDVAGAKAALSQAAMYGVAPSTIGRVARSLASIAGDASWYEDATKRLIAAGADGDAVWLYVDLVRARHARGDEDGAAKAVREMAAVSRGTWLSRVLEAFLPRPEPSSEVDPEQTLSRGGARDQAAIEELASLETDPDLARGLSLVAAARALQGGDPASARKRLRELVDGDASDPVASAFLAELDRTADDHAAAARTAGGAAAAAHDAALAAALHLESAFEHWRAGDRKAAIEAIEAAAQGAPDAARLVLSWASRGVDVDTLDGRRRAIERALAQGTVDPHALALERFAAELSGGDPDDAATALTSIEQSPEGDLGVAAALARLVWSGGAADAEATRAAIVRLAARGPRALTLATAEQFRIAREAGDAEELVRAGARWFEAGGGLTAALEWLGAALVVASPEEEKKARLAVAGELAGDSRDAMIASAALLEPRIHPYDPAPLIGLPADSVRLANLELSPPGSDPRRRAFALGELGASLGDDAAVDATAMSGWSALAALDFDGARAAFEKATAARPEDLASWEGLRTWGELTGDKTVRARAAAELGARCHDPARGAVFWEEAALLYLEVRDDGRADAALEAGFARDPHRPVTFDKLFRRVRERKDNDRLLTIVARRLQVTDEPQEIQKLFWEQARVLREKGDQDGALAALEHVTMLEPDHVGALALLGEINIRRGNFEQAAESLGRLAVLDAAPAKNRVTAGVAAVDLYENKLNQFDKALQVLLALHAAKLSTLPVRERLARAAARTGSWKEATSILEELMQERPTPDGRIEAARLAMAIHRDRLGDPQGAARAIVKLLEESPIDGEALEMLLQTEHPTEVRERLLIAARAALVSSLQARPTDLPAVRRLVKVSRALSDDALQQAALGMLVSLGAADAQAEATFTQLASRKARSPQTAIADAMLRSILAPGDDGPIADLFVVLGPTLAEAFGPSLQACGVGRRDKVDPRSGLALRNEIAAWAGAFGVKEFDLYVGGKEALAVQGIPGETPALVVGASVNAPLSAMTRGRVARELLAMTRGTTIVRSRDDITVAAIVVAACGQAEIKVDHPPYAVLAEVERLLGKALGRKTRKLLPDICRSLVSGNADARAWSKRALASHDRVAVVASGDPAVVLAEVLGVPPDKLGAAVKGNVRAEELLRFVASPRYLEIRRALGLEGGA